MNVQARRGRRQRSSMRPVAPHRRWRVGNGIAGLIVAGLLFALPTPAVQASPALEAAFADHLESRPGSDAELTILGQFYAERAWLPLWSGDPAAVTRARAALAALAQAPEHGLDPDHYALPLLTSLASATDQPSLVRFEREMSRNVLRYARDLGFGRLAVKRDAFDVPTAAASFDPKLVLEGLATAPDPAAFLAGLAPLDPAYVRLKGLLADLRRVAERGGWPVVAAGETLRLGTAAPAVAVLRQRLLAGGDLGPGAGLVGGAASPDGPTVPDPGTAAAKPSGEQFDGVLEAGVKAFQRRHGLGEDGAVGPATLRALNTSVQSRIDQAVVNLERLRQQRRDLGARHVVVNVPDYRLFYVDETGPAPIRFDSPVVVGTKKNQTPTFSGLMTYLELNPTWHVPRSIAVEDFLPKIRNDPGYLERNQYGLYAGGNAVDPWAVDWSTVGRSNFPFRIRQRPGAKNALGGVKFMFPNKYDVYIHDTPTKSLFARAQRAFSHGCIRLSNPFRFAELLLGGQGWDRAQIDAAVASGKTRRVDLDQPLPVHITYVTAWVEPDGTAQWRDDVYGRDAVRSRDLATRATRPFAAEVPSAPPPTFVPDLPPSSSLEPEVVGSPTAPSIEATYPVDVPPVEPAAPLLPNG